MDGYPSGLPGAETIPQLAGELSSEDFIFEALEAFDATAINVPHYRGAPVPQAMLVDAIGALSERARTLGRGVLLEFQPGSGVHDFPAAVDIVEATGASNAMATLDTVQMYAAGGDASQLTPERVARLGAFQLADKKGPPVLGRIEEKDRFSRELPGDGDIPLRDMLRRILSVSPDMPIGVEIFNLDLKGRSYNEAAVLAAEATRRLLETV
jgi:sugar phosphate isomerase/epimerase